MNEPFLDSYYLIGIGMVCTLMYLIAGIGVARVLFKLKGSDDRFFFIRYCGLLRW